MRLVHRATTSASPDEVWALLADPGCWPEFDVRLRRVRGTTGEAEAGQHLLAVARVIGLPVPLDVVEVVPGKRLVLLLYLAPGLRERATFELVELLRGGTRITGSSQLDGPFARFATVPVWFGTGVLTRLLARRATRPRPPDAGRRSTGAA